VLTLGTALDANILINERIREESRTGGRRSRRWRRVHQGLRHDHGQQPDEPDRHGPASTLRLGPVRGFAVTVAIGTIVQMWTATTWCG
jgi:preprotein translocase subunit SecD